MKVLRDVQVVVSLVSKDLEAKAVYEESLKDFMATKYGPVFEIADEEQRKRLATELGKVTTAAAGDDPDFAQVESMLMLIEPLLEANSSRDRGRQRRRTAACSKRNCGSRSS